MIVLALPTALAGIVWMLFLTNTTLSVPALTGAIMCMGVATANSILVISFAREQLAAGQNAFQAALLAGATRFRPVLMTALAMIIGMAPMAIEPGQNAPLGRAVIGGLDLRDLRDAVLRACSVQPHPRTRPRAEPCAQPRMPRRRRSETAHAVPSISIAPERECRPTNLLARPDQGAEAFAPAARRRRRDRRGGVCGLHGRVAAARRRTQEVAQRTAEEAIPPSTSSFRREAPRRRIWCCLATSRPSRPRRSTPRASGYVSAWYKDIGAKVTKGEKLADIDTPELDQQYRPGEGRSRQRRRQLQARDSDRRSVPRARQAVVRLASRPTIRGRRRSGQIRRRRLREGQSRADRIPRRASKRSSRRSTAS